MKYNNPLSFPIGGIRYGSPSTLVPIPRLKFQRVSFKDRKVERENWLQFELLLFHINHCYIYIYISFSVGGKNHLQPRFCAISQLFLHCALLDRDLWFCSCWSHFSSLGIGNSSCKCSSYSWNHFAFTFHLFSSSSFNFWYFSNFSPSFFQTLSWYIYHQC